MRKRGGFDIRDQGWIVFCEPFFQLEGEGLKFRSGRGIGNEVAGVDLDRGFSDKSEVGIEMDIIIEDLFGDSFSAKGDEVVDAAVDFVDIARLQPS